MFAAWQRELVHAALLFSDNRQQSNCMLADETRRHRVRTNRTYPDNKQRCSLFDRVRGASNAVLFGYLIQQFLKRLPRLFKSIVHLLKRFTGRSASNRPPILGPFKGISLATAVASVYLCVDLLLRVFQVYVEIIGVLQQFSYCMKHWSILAHRERHNTTYSTCQDSMRVAHSSNQFALALLQSSALHSWVHASEV